MTAPGRAGVQPIRIASLAHWPGGRTSGPFHKILGQVRAWNDLGERARLFITTSSAAAADWQEADPEAVVRTARGEIQDLRQHSEIASDIIRWEPQIVYLRHGLWRPGLHRLAQALPVVLEINGNDLAEMQHWNVVRRSYHRLSRSRLLQDASGLVFVSGELAKLPTFPARPSIVIGNGLDLSRYESLPPTDNAEPRLIFLGQSENPWYGLPAVISLARAFPDWRFDVVGVKDSACMHHPPNLLLHPAMSRPEYQKLLAMADVGIGSLAMRDAGLQEATPLKVREYLAYGLPVITSHTDTDFPDGSPFMLRIPQSLDALGDNLDDIASFVRGWRGRRVPRNAVQVVDSGRKEVARVAFLRRVVYEALRQEARDTGASKETPGHLCDP